jgi:hypothetical protein
LFWVFVFKFYSNWFKQIQYFWKENWFTSWLLGELIYDEFGEEIIGNSFVCSYGGTPKNIGMTFHVPISNIELMAEKENR